ncbi:MAG: winged helix DNA-binding domain-containing protein [Corynebacteriales bacterium]|nr:winged helix DNA-binding domain-containing protein [Mycobacteriales bacterium]
MTSSERISLEQWNRTVLTRQHLLERVDDDAVEVLDRCVGLQSQDPRAAFFGLFSRVVDFDPAELDGLMIDREVVRMALLRSTVFCIDAADARWIRPLAQPTLDAELRTNHLRNVVAADPAAVTRHARELLTGREMSTKALGAALAERFPGESASTLCTIARCTLPLVQVPPRGLFAGSGATTYRLFDEWVGPGEPAVTADEAIKDLIRLYLRGFGPSTVAGVQSWSGLTRLREPIEAMERDWELNRLTGPDGEELFDLDGLDIAAADEPAPARLLAPFDNVVVAQADRRRVIDEDVYKAMATPNGRLPGFAMVDGRVVGSWRVDAAGAVSVEYLRDVPASRRRALDAEVDAVSEFVRRPND